MPPGLSPFDTVVRMCDRSLVIKSSASKPRPIAIDLFSGAGGLSLGFETAGFDVVSAVEYDPVHAATHLYNFPLTDVICRDISTVTRDELLRSAQRGFEAHNPGSVWDGVVHAIMGGPSCQGFSTMGKQDAEDERNQLLFEFVRLVLEVKPLTFCIENVPGLLDPRFAKIRERVLGDLRSAGYVISGEDVVLRAEDFGVPQRRRRLVILGSLVGEAPSRPAPTSGDTHTVEDAFAGLPNVGRYPSLTKKDSIELSQKATEALASASNDYLKLADILGDGSGHFGHSRAVEASVLTGCRLTTHSAVSIDRFKATPQGTKEPVSRYYRLSTTGAALTLRAGTGRERGAFSAARPLHPTQPRVISVREAARLHSFPDWFRFHTTNWHGHRQIGNAVPPLLARAAATSLLLHLGFVPTKSELPTIALGDARLLTLSPTAAAEQFQASQDQVPKRRRADTLTMQPDQVDPSELAA